MRHCAFLTMEDTAGWSIDADLAVAPLQDLGWQVETLPWRAANSDWRRFDAVYVGTPWDYPDDPALFIRVLEGIDASPAVLVNPLPILRWNMAKTYLRDLERRGADIVPTEWFERLDANHIETLAERCRDEQLIVKPVVSTNARDTFLLNTEPDPATRDLLLQTFTERACMVQPFVASIRTIGEYSLFYIGGEISHSIRKLPQSGDFRVQEEHGASIEALQADAGLLDAAYRVMQLIEPQPLYGRVDFVLDSDNVYRLMELELIEPSLYLRMDNGAPRRFAAAFDAYVRAKSRSESAR